MTSERKCTDGKIIELISKMLNNLYQNKIKNYMQSSRLAGSLALHCCNSLHGREWVKVNIILLWLVATFLVSPRSSFRCWKNEGCTHWKQFGYSDKMSNALKANITILQFISWTSVVMTKSFFIYRIAIITMI